MKLRNTLYALTILFSLVVSASAQVEVGAFAGATTSPDPNDAPGGRTKFFPGVVASFETPVSDRFGFKVNFKASRTPQLPTLFTTDEGEHRPTYEVRTHPQFQVNLGRFYAAAGADVFYQGGFDDDPGEEYSRSLGVNPTATVGAKITKNHDISATYLFRDKGTDLYGFRADYFYTLPKGFEVGFQANRLWFKERNREDYVDSYYEIDNVFQLSFTIPLTKRGYKH